MKRLAIFLFALLVSSHSFAAYATIGGIGNATLKKNTTTGYWTLDIDPSSFAGVSFTGAITTAGNVSLNAGTSFVGYVGVTGNVNTTPSGSALTVTAYTNPQTVYGACLTCTPGAGFGVDIWTKNATDTPLMATLTYPAGTYGTSYDFITITGRTLARIENPLGNTTNAVVFTSFSATPPTPAQYTIGTTFAGTLLAPGATLNLDPNSATFCHVAWQTAPSALPIIVHKKHENPWTGTTPP